MPIVPAFDGFRAIAIGGVVLVHVLAVSGVLEATAGSAGGVLLWGALGNIIDAFFIISGFVLFLPIVVRGGELGSLRRYAIGRTARLLPAYWLSLGVMVVLLVVVPPSGFGTPPLGEIGIHIGALQMPARMLDPGLAVGFGINGPLWMISVIVGFYLVLPLIARPYFRHPLVGLVLALAVTVLWKEAALHTGMVGTLSGGGAPRWALELIAIDQFPGWAFSFALGMTGAWAYVRLTERHSRAAIARLAARLLVPVAVGYLALAYLYGETSLEIVAPFTGGLARAESFETALGSLSRAALMAVIALGPLWLQRPFANRAVVRLAELSYGLYLAHLVVMSYLVGFAGGLPIDGSLGAFAVWGALVVPASLLYAYLSRRFVELPVQRRVRELERRSRPAAQSAAAPAGG